MRYRSPVLWSVLIFSVKITWASRDKSSSSSSSPKIEWISPSPSTEYRPGDIIVGKWTSKKAIVSPSVELCTTTTDSGDTSDDSGANCGQTVWPSVKQDSDDYSFSFTAPDVASDSSEYFLQMKDDFGNVMQSPAFSLSKSATSSQSNSADASTSDSTSNKGDANAAVSAAASANTQGGSYTSNSDDSSQVAVSDSSEDLSSGSDTDESDATVSPAVNKKSSSTQSADKNDSAHVTHAPAAESSPSDTSGSIGSSGSTKGSGSPVVPGLPLGDGLPPGNASAPDKDGPSSAGSASIAGSLPLQDGTTSALTTHAALPTAAIAVPLALVGATLVASLALWFAHRRALAAQRTKNAQIVARATSVRSSRSRGSMVKRSRSVGDPDIEKAIGALYESDRERERKQPLSRERYPIPRADVRRGQSCQSSYYDYDHDDDYGADDRAYSDDDRDSGHFDGRRSVSSHRSYATYERPRYIHHRSCDRLHSGRCSIDRAQQRHNSSTRRDTFSSYAASRRSGSSLRSGGRRSHTGRASMDDGNESTTESILTDYLPTSRAGSRFGGSGAIRSSTVVSHPRLPPRTHTRRSAQDVDDHRGVPRHSYRRKREVKMCSPLSDSHRTV